MRDTMRALLVSLLAAWTWACFAQDKPPDEKPLLLMMKVGERAFGLGGGRELRIPWYRVEVDYNEMAAPKKDFVRVVKPDGSATAYRPLNWCDRIATPEGTVTAYVGDYGDIHWDEWPDDKTEVRLSAWGVDFTGGGNLLVKPGPGKVKAHYWLFEEKPRADGMMLEDGRYYVFCLDRQPLERWKYRDGEPACDLDGELDHVIAIIAVQPTFDFSKVPRTEAPYVTADSLESFREVPQYDPKEMCSVVRGGDGRLRFETGDGNSAPAKAETVQKLLYALNTSQWRRIDPPGEIDRLKPANEISVEFKDAEGKIRKIFEEQVTGQWLVICPGTTYYAAPHPDLLFEVAKDIRAACTNKTPKAGAGK